MTVPYLVGRAGTAAQLQTMGQLNDLSMTFDVTEGRGVKGEPEGMPSRIASVVIPQQFGGERASHRSAKP